MEWRIDPRDTRPPFEQLRTQTIDAIRAGELRVGEKLPTVRQLAAATGVAANTAARAYRELELAGVIETRGRAGSYVKVPEDSLQREAVERTRAYLEDMKALGFDGAACADMVRALAHGES